MFDNFKSHVFNRHEIWGFNSTLINYCNENVLNKLSTNFFTGCSEKVALEITKRAQHCVLPWFIRFHVFWNRTSVLAFRGLRVYKGHLQNEWVIKPFLKRPKSRKFVCIKSSLQCMHNLNPFCRTCKISRIPLIDFCETSPSRGNSKEYVAFLKNAEQGWNSI